MAVKKQKQITGKSERPGEVVPASSTPTQEPLLVEQDPNDARRVQMETVVQERFMQIAQSKNIKVAQHLLSPLTRIVLRFSTADTLAESLMIALEMLENLSPQGAAQHMLAQQMICTHFAALASLTTSGAEDNTIEQADHYSNRAGRLLRLGVAQQQMWAQIKGQTGQQRVVVEHVNVAPGGQAVVGLVTRGVEGSA